MVCYLDALLLRNASLKNAFHEKMLKTIYHETEHFFYDDPVNIKTWTNDQNKHRLNKSRGRK